MSRVCIYIRIYQTLRPEIREIKNFLWTCDVEMVIYIEWTYCVGAAV